MKKIKIIVCIILLSSLLLTLFCCTAPNIDKRLVGTWISKSYGERSTYIFRANGTFERYFDGNLSDGKYTCEDGVITFDYGEEYKPREKKYRVNDDKNSIYYGEIKIDLEYFIKK